MLYTSGTNDPKIGNVKQPLLLQPSYFQQFDINWDESFGGCLLHVVFYFGMLKVTTDVIVTRIVTFIGKIEITLKRSEK